MKKLTFIVLFLSFVNAEFSTSMFLKNIQNIQNIHISYANAHGNEKRITVNMNNEKVSDELMIFSEEKRQTSLREIALAIPDKITSIEIEYVDKSNKLKSKFMGIALDDREMKGDNLYLYQDKDFKQEESVKEVNFSSLFKNASKSQKTTKKHIAKKSMGSKTTKTLNPLKIKHSENEDYIDIEITNCGNKTFDICDEVKLPSIIGNSKKVIFYFNIEKDYKKLQNVSENIKRIEVGYNIKRDPPTHLVIEVYKKIVKVEKMYSKSGEFVSSKSTDFKANHKKISYRLHIR